MPEYQITRNTLTRPRHFFSKYVKLSEIVKSILKGTAFKSVVSHILKCSITAVHNLFITLRPPFTTPSLAFLAPFIYTCITNFNTFTWVLCKCLINTQWHISDLVILKDMETRTGYKHEDTQIVQRHQYKTDICHWTYKLERMGEKY